MKQGNSKWRVPDHAPWTVEDGEAAVAAWQSSGLSMRAFSREYGVPAHRLSYWRNRLKDRQPDGAKSAFVPVEVVDRAPALAPEAQIEVPLRSGQKLRFRGCWDPEALLTWLRALEGAC